MAAGNPFEFAPESAWGRYGPGEALSHEVIRQTGHVLLWKTIRQREPAPGVAEYHVTNADHGVYSLIQDEEEAGVNFEMYCATREPKHP